MLSLIGLDVAMTSNVTVINGTQYEMTEADKTEVKVDKEYEVNSTDIELDEESFLTHGVEVNYMFFNISVKMSNRSERVTAMCLLPKDVEDSKPLFCQPSAKECFYVAVSTAAAFAGVLVAFGLLLFFILKSVRKIGTNTPATTFTVSHRKVPFSLGSSVTSLPGFVDESTQTSPTLPVNLAKMTDDQIKDVVEQTLIDSLPITAEKTELKEGHKSGEKEVVPSNKTVPKEVVVI